METITFGDRDFEVGKLPLRLVKQVAKILDEPAETTDQVIDRCLRIIAVPLIHADQSLTLESIEDMPASMQELQAATAAVMRIIGIALPPPPELIEPGP